MAVVLRSDGCGEQVTNWHYVIQSSFALHLLHFELSRISLSVPLDTLLYHLLLRQSSFTVHVRRSTHLLLFHDALFIIRKAQVEVCERRGKSVTKYFKGPFIKMLRRNTPYGNIVYIKIQLKVTRK